MTDITGNTTIHRNPELLSVEMDGDLVMMSIETGNYFGVSGIGPGIWDMLEAPRTFDALVQSIVEDYEVEADVAAADLRLFLARLAENGMIEVG